MKVSEIGEFGLIEKLARHAGAGNSRLICGMGDDCAVAESGRKGHALLMTTDALIEGVHFRLPTTSPRLLGRKALAVNLSDIAAMGGSPSLFTVTLGIPPETPVEWVDDVYAGLAERASDYRAVLAGGDTASSPGTVSLSIALLGECPTDEVVYRSGARAGEAIYVTGHLGESAVGLRLLESKGTMKSHGTEKDGGADFDALIRRHLDPEPRLAAGRRLAKDRLASAMIDISDGLTADLMHILRRSRVGGTLQARALPLSGGFRRACEYLGIDPVMTGLAGGEEYELLFTGAPDLDEKELARAMGRPVTRVGSITGEPGRLEIFDDKGRPLQPPETGYDHFRPAASLPFTPARGSKNA